MRPTLQETLTAGFSPNLGPTGSAFRFFRWRHTKTHTHGAGTIILMLSKQYYRQYKCVLVRNYKSRHSKHFKQHSSLSWGGINNKRLTTALEQKHLQRSETCGALINYRPCVREIVEIIIKRFWQRMQSDTCRVLTAALFCWELLSFPRFLSPPLRQGWHSECQFPETYVSWGSPTVFSGCNNPPEWSIYTFLFKRGALQLQRWLTFILCCCYLQIHYLFTEILLDEFKENY